MMEKIIGVALIAIVLLMPVATSNAIAQIYVPTREGRVVNIYDAPEACIEKAEKSSALADVLDTGVIGFLESAISVLNAICTTKSAIEEAVMIVMSFTGFPDSCIGVFFIPICMKNAAEKSMWDSLREGAEWTCEFVSCSATDCRAGALSKIPGNKFFCKGRDFLLEKKTAFGQEFSMHISPYENIYVAIATACLPGILYNLRQLRTMYQTHKCCVQEACMKGRSTELCDRQFFEASCMYWKGSLANTAIKAVIGWASDSVSIYIVEKVLPTLGPWMPAALYTILVMQSNVEQVRSAWKWVSHSFHDPDCSELSFEDIEELREQYTRRMLEGTLRSDEIAEYRKTVEEEEEKK